MTSSNLFIAPQSLTRLAKELINKRNYDPTKISVVGVPIITEDGILGSTSSESYAHYAGIDLSNAEEIKIESKFKTNQVNDKQYCVWSMSSSNNSSSMSLLINKNSIELASKIDRPFLLENITIPDETEVSMALTLTINTYRAVLNIGGKFVIREGDLSRNINMKGLSRVYFGFNPSNPSNIWTGSIYLADFILSKNNKIIYAPSTDQYFSFSKILISDGAIPLTNESVPMKEHIVELKIEEVSRSGKNVVIKSALGSETSLKIFQIGLYINYEGKEELFALTDGILINKPAGLSYTLVFNINAILEVANTIALPEIVVIQKEFPKFREFTTIEQVLTYIVTNLERIIVNNGMKLGYGATLELFHKLLKVKENVQSFQSARQYNNLSTNIRTTVDYSFSPLVLETAGDVTVDENLNMGNFSIDSYAQKGLAKTSPASMSLNMSLTCGATKDNNYAMSLFSNPEYPTIEVGLDTENNLVVSASDKQRIQVHADNKLEWFNRSIENDTFEDNDERYYAWKSESETSFTNPHVEVTGSADFANGAIYNFGPNSYAVSDDEINFGPASTVTVAFVTASKDVRQCLFCTLDNSMRVEYFQGNLYYSIGDGENWIHTDIKGSTSAYDGLENTLEIQFNGSSYLFYLNNQGDSAAVSDEIRSQKIKFGLNQDGLNTWKGYINLLNSFLYIQDVSDENYEWTSSDDIDREYQWRGSCTSNLIFTKTDNVGLLEQLYDNELYPCKDASIRDLYNKKYTIVSSDANSNWKEPLKQGFKYYVRASYEGNILRIELSETGMSYADVGYINFTYGLNGADTLYIGKDGTDYFTGEVSLPDFTLTMNTDTYRIVQDTYRYAELKNFYYFPEVPYYSYYVKNMKDPSNSGIFVIDNTFSSFGKNDINLSSEKGSTLCVKAMIVGGNDKTILSIHNEERGLKYFELAYQDKKILATLYTEQETVRLQKEYDIFTFRQVLDYPVCFFFVIDKSDVDIKYKLYVNNELVDEISSGQRDFLKAEEFKIYGNSLDSEEEGCVQEIVCFEGALTRKDIHYVNRLVNPSF